MTELHFQRGPLSFSLVPQPWGQGPSDADASEYSMQWRRQGGRGEASPIWVDVQKLCNMYVLSLSWNFVSHDKYIARPSSKEPRWYTDNTTGTVGLRTLDPL